MGVRGLNYVQMRVLFGESTPLGPVGPPIADPVTYLIEEADRRVTGVGFGTPQTIITVNPSGGVTADDTTIYVLSRSVVSRFSRESPYTREPDIAISASGTYAGIAIDDQYLWVWNETTRNTVVRMDKDGGNQVVYSTPAGTSLRHTGMARVGDNLYVSDGDTSTVTIFAVPGTGTTLTRIQAIPAPVRSFGFWTDGDLFFYSDYAGNFRVHNSAGTEIARSTTAIHPTLVGITVFDGILYTIGETNPRAVRATPLTINTTGGRRLVTEDGRPLITE